MNGWNVSIVGRDAMKNCWKNLLFCWSTRGRGTRKGGGNTHDRTGRRRFGWREHFSLVSWWRPRQQQSGLHWVTGWLTDTHERSATDEPLRASGRKRIPQKNIQIFFLLASFGGNTTRFERSSKSYFLPNWKIQLMGQSIFKSPKNDNFTIEWNKNSQKVVKWPLSDNKSKHLPIFWQNIIFALRNGRRT